MGARTAGMVDVWVADAHRRQGMGLSLVGEILRQASEQGYGLVEVQTMQQNSAARALYQKLGFEQIDSGAIYRKET